MLHDMDFVDNIALLESTQYGTQQLSTATEVEASRVGL